MLRFGEVRQRLNLYNMHIGREGASADYRVAFADEPYHKAEVSAYYTDDLEDALLTGQQMARERQSVPAMKG